MPRVAGIYSRPTGIDAVANNTIDSGKYNSNVADVEADLNLPRPIVAGGTGATSALEARDNLDAEVAAVQVTNFNSHVFENGSFWCSTGTPGAPTNDLIGGVAVLPDNNQAFVVLHAHAFEGAPNPGPPYIREKSGGVWTAWKRADQSAIDVANTKVDRVGDTMTGDLGITHAGGPTFKLNKTANVFNSILGQKNAVSRWRIDLGDGTADAGGGANTGSDFNIARYGDGGSELDRPLVISRSTGSTLITGSVGINAAVGSSPGIGNANTGITLSSSGSVFSSTSGAVVNVCQTSNGYNTAYYCNGTLVGGVICNTTSTTYNTGSDIRLKEDLKSFDAGRIVDATEVYNFRWKGTGERAYGVSAQQASEIYPEAVFHDEKTDWWGIDYSRYVPVILQELKALRARVAELEGLAKKIEAL